MQRSYPDARPDPVVPATPEQKANSAMYAGYAAQTSSFYIKNGLAVPNAGNIAAGVKTDAAMRDRAKQLTKAAPVAAAAVAAAPVVGPAIARGAVSVVTEGAAFVKDPIGYCLTNYLGCAVAGEAAIYTIAGVPQPNSAIILQGTPNAVVQLTSNTKIIANATDDVARGVGSVVRGAEAERGLGSTTGHQFAIEIREGGSGQALAGHGVMEGNAVIIGNGSVTVPSGTTVITPRPDRRIAESTGQLLENVTSVEQLESILRSGVGPTGRLNKRNYDDLAGYNVFSPGDPPLNYTLLDPGYGGKPLSIFTNSTTTNMPTHLSEFLQPNMGCVFWAACTEVVPFVPRKP